MNEKVLVTGMFEAIQGAFQDTDVVVHLAEVIHDGFGWRALLNAKVMGNA
ncbi:MAG: hypothetical protein JJ934_06670 [Pseudomonadales bacterium]|nr:hypothetical protein [Pseudomonadales bacterium]MBO6594751.1 hypothetical protein [Pseudomonadales bacterium]MBO6656556.1 hypothetical protein [Pseudomonadales bacterium]MBO6821689.1 hypothetical protein [Pseudomonadales bacterium]